MLVTPLELPARLDDEMPDEAALERRVGTLSCDLDDKDTALEPFFLEGSELRVEDGREDTEPCVEDGGACPELSVMVSSSDANLRLDMEGEISVEPSPSRSTSIAAVLALLL